MKRTETALIKDLELQIDFLIGYAPQGLHWKQEYHFRQELIEQTLADENTPQEIVDKISRIQDKVYQLKRKETHSQEYLKALENIYRPKHKVKVNDYANGETYYIEI